MATAIQGGPAALRRAVRELTARWQDEGRYQPRSDNWMRGFDPAFSKELSRLGLIGMTWPAQYGGGERSHADRLAVTEELLRAGAPVAAHWIADRQIGPAILRHGSARLRAEILPGIVAADLTFCLGMSEPEAGSDLASVQTRGTADGTGWRLRGRKIWTTGAHLATHAYVLARTSGEADKHDGLTEFIVDMDTPGITVTPIRDLTGQHHFNEVTFDDAAVPAHRVLGQVGNGWRQVVEQLSFERGGPERMLSSYPLLAAALSRPGRAPQPGADRELGRARRAPGHPAPPGGWRGRPAGPRPGAGPPGRHPGAARPEHATDRDERGLAGPGPDRAPPGQRRAGPGRLHRLRSRPRWSARPARALGQAL